MLKQINQKRIDYILKKYKKTPFSYSEPETNEKSITLADVILNNFKVIHIETENIL